MTFWPDGAKCSLCLFWPRRLHSVRGGWRRSYDGSSEPGWTASRCWRPAAVLSSTRLASDTTTQRVHSQSCTLSTEPAGRGSARADRFFSHRALHACYPGLDVAWIHQVISLLHESLILGAEGLYLHECFLIVTFTFRSWHGIFLLEVCVSFKTSVCFRNKQTMWHLTTSTC